MVGSGGGVGYYLWNMANVGLYENAFAAMVIIGIIGLVMFKGAELIERRLSKWMGML
jgi:ABC-type nitrate/sulfonate/bicarbonate transport system permease component